MVIKGTIKVLEESKFYGRNDFEKRLLVVTTDEKYAQYLPIEFLQDKANMLDNFLEGQEVEVSINLRGSEYQGKYYLSANGWKITLAGGATPTAKPQPKTELPNEPELPAAEEEQDDLPF